MAKKELHRLVDDLPEHAVEGTAVLLQRVSRGEIDPDQSWFWTRVWQEGEREADADLAAGRIQRFEGDDAFFAHLDAVPPASS
jgi:hypothetical protein